VFGFKGQWARVFRKIKPNLYFGGTAMTNHGTAPTLGQFAELNASVPRVLPKALTGINLEALIACLNTDSEGFADMLNNMFREYLSEMQGQYSVTVPYRGTETITDLLAAGRYDWTNDDITDEHYPQEKSGDEEVAIELVHIGHAVSSEDAIKELKMRGLRPANVAEILAFGTAYPDVQPKCPVISLGQGWHNPGDYGVVYLSGSGAKWRVDLSWFENDWSRLCCFAGVRACL